MERLLPDRRLRIELVKEKAAAAQRAAPPFASANAILAYGAVAGQ